MATGFSVISLIAYDYELLLKSIPRYIEHVDEVILGLDKDHRTWAGNYFELPKSFFDELKLLDPDNKIKIIEESFHIAGVKPLDLDTRERNQLSTHAREGNWIISIDADEMVLNFTDLLNFLSEQQDTDICVQGTWIVVFKKLAASYLLISAKLNGALDSFPLATKNVNGFIDCRDTKQRRVLSPLQTLHFAYGRTEEALYQKLTNWGHKTDFDVESYFRLWKSLDESNYIYIRNFHPLFPHEWVELVKIEESELSSVTQKQLQPRAIIEAGSVRKFANAFWQRHKKLLP